MTILDKITASVEADLINKKQQVPLSALKEQVKGTHRGFCFEKALKEPKLSFICEVKKASPSKGVIAEDFPYLEIAGEYEAAGAAALSVLTEPHFFLGKPQYLTEIKKQVTSPVLRKDFIIEPWQIYETVSMGADAVLFICSILDQARLTEFIKIADRYGLSALVEIHDEEEGKQALQAGARIIGVNNRNLKDFTVDIQNSIRLRRRIPEDIAFVAESGIKTPEDIRILTENKVNGALIGETLMRAENKKEMLDMLREGTVIND